MYSQSPFRILQGKKNRPKGWKLPKIPPPHTHTHTHVNTVKTIIWNKHFNFDNEFYFKYFKIVHCDTIQIKPNVFLNLTKNVLIFNNDFLMFRRVLTLCWCAHKLRQKYSRNKTNPFGSLQEPFGEQETIWWTRIHLVNKRLFG